jgi:hypothetical protein
LQHKENKSLFLQKIGRGFIFFPVIKGKRRQEQQKTGIWFCFFYPYLLERQDTHQQKTESSSLSPRE